MTENEYIVELQQVSRVYYQGKVEVKAVDNLDLQFRPGEFSALCGPSGSGKTTILNMIGALDTPTSGSVLLEGKDLSNSTISGANLSGANLRRAKFINSDLSNVNE